MVIDIAVTAESVDDQVEWREQARPWPRFWARLLDVTVNGTILAFTLGVLFPSLIAAPVFDGQGGGYLFGLLVIPFSLVIDALSQTLTGNTLGKLIAGIRVETIRHERLPLMLALERNLSLYVKGLVLGLPLLCLIGYSRAWDRLKQGDQTAWDEELYTRVYDNGSHVARTALAAFLYLGLMAGGKALEIADANTSLDDAAVNTPTYSSQPAPDPIAQQLAKAAKQVKPQMVDEITKLDGATTDGRILTCHYKITRRDVSDGQLRTFFERKQMHEVCAEPNMRSDMKDYGITYRYSYLMPNSEVPVDIDVDWAACLTL